MKSGPGLSKTKMRFQFFIIVPEFLTHVWMLEQERRAQSIVQRYLLGNDIENKSGLRAYRSLRAQRSIVIEALDLRVLEAVRHEFDRQGFYVEGGVHVEHR